MYKQLDDCDMMYLKSFISEERLFTGEAINPDYDHDELGGVSRRPDVLIEAETAEEIARIMAYANEKRIPVVARGSGTGLTGASVPVHGGMMISTSRMNKILELDWDNLTLTVEPGALLMEIAAYAEANGLLYPPDPGEKSATIGGNISTNAGGMRAVKYGVTRDYVRGLQVVTPEGHILELGGKIVKNVSGYSLKDLIVGSEGTLAVITKAILKLIPLPRKTVSLLIPFPDVEKAVGSVTEIMKTPVIPTAVEFMEREVILDAERFLGKRFPDKDSAAYLLLSYDGQTGEEIQRNYAVVADICLARGAGDVLIVDTDERREAVWTARGAFLEAISASTTEMDECDVVVPKNHVAEFVLYTATLRERYGVRIKSFGHAGDGNLHIYILRDALGEAEWKAKLSAVFDDLFEKAAQCGGKVSGEHGVGFAKLPYLSRNENPAAIMIMRNIKRAFDPNGILNPGKIFD